MHELGITQEIVSRAADRAEGRRVVRVVVEIGKLSAVLPDAVRFCFALCAEGTSVEGAALEIIEPAGLVQCRMCRDTFEIEKPFGRCACGSTELDWLSGEELRVKEMEVI